MIKRLIAGIILLACMLCSCSIQGGPSALESTVDPKSDLSESEKIEEQSEESLESEPAEQPESVAELSYVQNLAAQTVEVLSVNVADGESAVREIYHYLIQNVFFADPVGLDTWRYLSDEPDIPIPYIENRALSPLLFQIGSCEDFAAAMVMLLHAAGFQADYVAGYTISIEGDYIDHAWATVKLDGQWYHIDPQLEQNVIRGYTLTYWYYLKSDEIMLADHRWGENLISFWDMPEGEQINIRQYFTPPACPKSYPTPPSEPTFLPRVPNADSVNSRIQQIKDESGKGQLQEIALNVEPPILVKEHHVTPPLLAE